MTVDRPLYADCSAPIELRVSDLLSRMTIEEKIGQMWQSAFIREDAEELIQNGQVGSFIWADTAYAGNEKQQSVAAARVNYLQRIAVEKSRLGIPLLFARDVIHGHRTVGPIPLGQAATWNPEVARNVARMAAREAASDGIRWTFAPMMDIARDPRWGRVAEGYGEDPYLAGEMAAATVRGFQGEDLAATDSLLACSKHYVGYGAAEGGRDYNTAEITPNTLQNIYLPPFHATVKAGVGSFMASFNEIGGEPVTANRALLTEKLKKDWGFDGFVVSDWNAVCELIEHGVAEGPKQAAELATNAGLDMEMASTSFRDTLPELLKEGLVSEETIDEAVRRLLRAKFRLGLFENPYTDETMGERVKLAPEHVTWARDAVRQSIILLKNQRGLLPLAKVGKRLGVFGPLIEAQAPLFGTWTLDGDENDVVKILDAVRSTVADPEAIRHSTLTDEALEMARWCDRVVAVVGESGNRSGEDHCTTNIDLPPGQQAVLEALVRMGKPLVVVVIAGRPLALEWVMEHADAVLYCFHGGVQTGPGLADVLFGDFNPTGRLPISLPRSVGQIPVYYNHKNTGRPLPKGGDRTRYIDSPDSPLIPFGFGLSYSLVSYDNLQIAELGEQRFKVSSTVKNNSDRETTEVVQLYIRDRFSKITRPVKELKGFARVSLQPGEQKTVEFDLGPEQLGYYGPGGKSIVEPGDFDVWIGWNSDQGMVGSLTVRA